MPFCKHLQLPNNSKYIDHSCAAGILHNNGSLNSMAIDILSKLNLDNYSPVQKEELKQKKNQNQI